PNWHSTRQRDHEAHVVAQGEILARVNAQRVRKGHEKHSCTNARGVVLLRDVAGTGGRMSDVQNEIMKPVELASLLGVTQRQVYRLISRGALPGVRGGGAIRIPRRAWEAWLAEQCSRALQATTKVEPVEP